jgi:hypothetical protein
MRDFAPPNVRGVSDGLSKIFAQWCNDCFRELSARIAGNRLCTSCKRFGRCDGDVRHDRQLQQHDANAGERQQYTWHDDPGSNQHWHTASQYQWYGCAGCGRSVSNQPERCLCQSELRDCGIELLWFRVNAINARCTNDTQDGGNFRNADTTRNTDNNPTATPGDPAGTTSQQACILIETKANTLVDAAVDKTPPTVADRRRK